MRDSTRPGLRDRLLSIGAAAAAAITLGGCATDAAQDPDPDQTETDQTETDRTQVEPTGDALRRGGHGDHGGRARNVILFVGDGMGISTISATRVFSVGVEGDLVLDQFPHSALSRTADADHITADSASTMTAMMTGTRANSGVLGFGAETEFGDFNGDGDGPRLETLLEQAARRGMRTGVVSTARVTHATPAACYAHIDDRDDESQIALQALPGDPAYNAALGSGIDLILGGGRQFFVPSTVTDEEGDTGSRTDGRDLRAEYQAAGYTYVWNAEQLDGIDRADLPLLGLFERGHMEYEYDRPTDVGGEPSLGQLTGKAIDLLEGACHHGRQGYFLMVEAGRIDHAHHAGNAWRALTDAEELDRAVGEALAKVDLRDTLVLVTADHSHVFTMAGYPLRPAGELGYPVTSAPAAYLSSPHNNLFDVVFDLDGGGNVVPSTDAGGVPYTVLGYQNGPGHRGVARVDPTVDPFPGLSGLPGAGPNDSEYLQESAVPIGSETHAGEDVALFAIGRGSELVHGTVENTRVHDVMAEALGL
ncbi:MAG TPA: alkaline phosphatase [Kofleriaceae bacterium]|nr:alkaline phosphatase [Kofleriaceae bacterium]